MDAMRGLFSDYKNNQARLRTGRVALPEQNDSRLRLSPILLLARHLLISQKRIGFFFALPRQPRTVEIVFFILSTFLHGRDELIEQRRQMRMNRVRKERYDKLARSH